MKPCVEIPLALVAASFGCSKLFSLADGAVVLMFLTDGYSSCQGVHTHEPCGHNTMTFMVTEQSRCVLHLISIGQL